jgi:hypothetical protein
MSLLDALDNAQGANKAAENARVVLAKAKPGSFMTEAHLCWSMPKHFA